MRRATVVLLGAITVVALTGCMTQQHRKVVDPQPFGAADASPRAGDIVRGSDHWRIGRIERVVEATDTTAAHLLVRRRGRVMDKVLELVQHGRLRSSGFQRQIYIPMGVPVRRVGSNVFIDVPRIAVRKMPWKQPPTRAIQAVKYGPRPEEVGNLYRTIAPTLHEPQPVARTAPGRGNPAYGARPGMGTSSGEGGARDHEGQSDQTFRARGDAGLVFPRGRTALLIIDPVNDFLSEGGAAWDLTKATVRRHNVVGNLKQAIEGARQLGIPVLFGPMAYTEEDYKKHQLHQRSGINRFQFERKMFLAGSWGADFHPDLRPREDDIVLLPHKGIDVFMTDLPLHLERLGITHLVIAGMTANLCVESTGRHGMEKGYDVTFLSNAIGADSHPSWIAAVKLNFPMVGNAVLKVDEFLSAIPAPDK